LVSASSIAETNISTLKLIPQLLSKSPHLSGSVFDAKNSKSGWIVSFCPDNTCNIIRAPRATPANAIGDFSALYLYYVSGYVYLKSFYNTDARPYMPSILERNAAKCQSSAEFAQAACVLNGLAKKHSIKIAFSRLDEGSAQETKLDVANELNEDHIKETKAWQTKEWIQHP
jgi:hypothetical protein